MMALLAVIAVTSLILTADPKGELAVSSVKVYAFVALNPIALE